MVEDNGVQQTSGQGLSIASLVLGILSIVSFLVPYIAVLLGVLAIVFGAVSLKKLGRKKSIAGIVTGSIGVVLAILVFSIVFAAIPSLQEGQRDVSRRNDVSILVSDVSTFTTMNRGQLPDASDLSVSNLAQITSIAGEGSPTTDTAIFTAGRDCDGASSGRAYAITVLLENGSEHCLGS